MFAKRLFAAQMLNVEHTTTWVRASVGKATKAIQTTRPSVVDRNQFLARRILIVQLILIATEISVDVSLL